MLGLSGFLLWKKLQRGKAVEHGCYDCSTFRLKQLQRPQATQARRMTVAHFVLESSYSGGCRWCAVVFTVTRFVLESSYSYCCESRHGFELGTFRFGEQLQLSECQRKRSSTVARFVLESNTADRANGCDGGTATFRFGEQLQPRAAQALQRIAVARFVLESSYSVATATQRSA